MTQVTWRWREHLVPKVFIGLLNGQSKEAALEGAIKAGRYQASRIYEVSLDGGQTWHSAPPDMSVIDINGNEMPAENRKSGRPSQAAALELDRRLLAAER